MAKCEICNKGVSFGIKVSHSHRRSNKMWKPNIRRVRAIVNGEHKRVHVCAHCLRAGKVDRGYGNIQTAATLEEATIENIEISAE